MYLTELFSKSLDWDFVHSDGDHLLARFMVDEYSYNVELRNGDGDFDVALGGPEEHLTGIWEVTFTQYSQRHGALDMLTGSGNALAVLTTVMEILTHIINEKNIQSISFTADNTEPSRVKLYDRLAKQFTKKGWRYIDNRELDARSDFYNDEITADDDFAAGRGYSHFILTKQPHPHSQLRGTKAA
jgi:hypothetical protein